MGRPVIGLCASVEQARWASWDMPAVLMPRDYVAAVQRGGGQAVLLVPDPASTATPDEVLDLLDGLILIGGSDVDPETYGAAPHPETVATAPERDAFEIALARRALERDLPFLGICRGMQVLNVAAGGTLHQHLPELQGHDGHRRNLGTFEGNDHQVSLDPGSLAARAAGEHHHRALSHHHQGIDDVGRGLSVTGRATRDGLAEALEAPDRRFALGVQWHPEADEFSKLIAALVDEARSRRER